MRVASLIGTARPRPTPATAVLTPTTREAPSASAPPELPGFRAASVWITFSTSRPAEPERVGSDAAQRRDDARGDRAGQAHRAADRDHQLPDPERVGVAERRRASRSLGLRADDGEVGERVLADHLGLTARGRRRRRRGRRRCPGRPRGPRSACSRPRRSRRRCRRPRGGRGACAGDREVRHGGARGSRPRRRRSASRRRRHRRR